MSFERIASTDFNEKFSTLIGKKNHNFIIILVVITLSFAELSSVALDGRIVSVSDEFFAEAFHLLLVEVS
jgi:allantoicase